MKIFENMSFDKEREFYNSENIYVKNCRFDGKEDGESAFKESNNTVAENCYWNLRYPFWHSKNIEIKNTEFTDKSRAAIWYCENIKAERTLFHGIKALRECKIISFIECDIISPEFGWFCDNIEFKNCKAESEYFMMKSNRLSFSDIELKGKYSFQYINDSVFENCIFDTKDAFWHAKNVKVKNSVINGEYLGWYSENLTFENCKIKGTQPLCYCKNLTLINCEMEESDLSFEKSDVKADIKNKIISIKNPVSGYIKVKAVDEIILDNETECRIEIL